MSLLSARNVFVAGSLLGVGMLLRPMLKAKLAGGGTCDSLIAVDDTEKEAANESEPNGAHVRSAGPQAMRDRPRRRWDRVDQAVDESFPASDPPSTY